MDAMRIQAKLAERLNSKLGYRGDLYLADYQTINANVAKVILGFSSHLGNPSGDDVRSFFIKQFEGRVMPKMDTAKIHSAEGAVSVVAENHRVTRKFDDIKTLIPIVANVRYMDNVMNETWEVKKGADGQKYLARICADNISEILKERRNRMQVQSTNLSIASILSSGHNMLEVGAIIKAMVDNQVVTAEVTQMNAGDIRIKADSGAYNITKEAVLEVLQASPKSAENDNHKLDAYFNRMFGNKDYADKLVSE